jgi:hypothetical protein
MAVMSPIQRTLAWLRDHGYEATKTEHFNWHAKVRQDLFGFIDVLAVDGNHLLAIQSSDGSHHAAHRQKIMTNKAAPLLAMRMDIEIWSWSLKLTGKRKADGLLVRKKEYALRREPLTAKLVRRGVSREFDSAKKLAKVKGVA